MASSSPSKPCSFEKHLTCVICIEPFTEPVTTACGHSFCNSCLQSHLKFLSSECPLCKTHINKTPTVSIVLRDLTQQLKDAVIVEDPDKVACDICLGPKRKAEKSCLVCLASYCSIHLQNHYLAERLKGHKLVEPVENLDLRACLTHGRTFELYSRKQQKCICIRCVEEGQEEVVSAEDEWHKKKSQLEDTKTELQQEIKKRQTKLDEINAALKTCRDHLENEWWDIEAVFRAVLAILETAQEKVLKPLGDRRQLLEKEAKDLKDELEAEINKLEKTISDLDDISVLEDHILFLQRYPSVIVQDDMRDWTKVELDTSLSFGTMKKTTTTMMERIQQELEKLACIELERLTKFKVEVQLDRTTAHQRLLVSDDGKEVKDGGEDQNVEEDPERFNHFGSVLAINSFTSGKSYWEVQVNKKTGWDLGVARGDANRKGKLTLSPDNGYWVLVHYEEENYAAMTAPPIRLSLKEKPTKVGVLVDHKKGLVSFYDVTARSHIYSFTNCSFKDQLYPYFSPHMRQDEKNSEPLVITAGKDFEKSLEEEWRHLCSISV